MTRALALAVLLATPRIAAAQQPAYFVLELTSNGVDQAIARNLSEIFTAAIRNTLPDARVVGQADINSMLALEKKKDLLGCAEDTSCLAEIGGALGADFLAVGSAGKIGKTYLLTLKLIDTQRAETTRHVSEEIEEPVERLIEATRQWGAHLVDPERPAGHGYLEVTGTGSVVWDGQELGQAPIEKREAEPGPHALAWTGADGTRHELTVRVSAYDTAEVSLVVERPPAEPDRDPDARWFGRAGSGGHHAFNTIAGAHQKVALEPNVILAVGYTFSFGLQVFASGSWFNWQFVEDNQSIDGVRMSVLAGGVGIGYEIGSSLRFAGTTTLEIGRVSSTLEGDVNTLSYVPLSTPVLVWNTSAALTYRVWRYLDIGLRLTLATHWTRADFPVTNDTDRMQTLVSPGFGLVLGVGPWP